MFDWASVMQSVLKYIVKFKIYTIYSISAKELKENAQAVAAQTKTLAEADREANITLAYVRGLQYTYLTLGVNDEDHKLSLMMMRALEDLNVKGNLYRGYGYNISTIASSP